MNELLLEERNLEKQDGTNNSKQSDSIKLVDLKKGVPGVKLKHVKLVATESLGVNND